MYKDILEKSDMLKLKKGLDKLFCSMLPNGFIEIEVDEILDKEILEKCDYFEKNPNFLQCVIPIKEKNLNNVMQNKVVEIDNLDENKMNYLSPAACLTIYPMLMDEKNIKNSCITCKSNVFRNEKTLEKGIRQLCYSVREIVFVGTKDYVEGQINRVCERGLEIANKITPLAHVVYAVDNFYPSTLQTLLEKFQKANNSKRELIVPINKKEIACASFNLHGNSFSKKYNFDDNGKIVTGCVGFGFERIISAYNYYNSDFIYNED